MIREVLDDEVTSRFILEKKNITSQEKPRSQVFSPHKDRLDLSVLRNLDLTEKKIWAFGKQAEEEINAKTTTPKKKELVGRAELLTKDYQAKELFLVPDNLFEGYHANVQGWEKYKDSEGAMLEVRNYLVRKSRVVRFH